MISFIVFIGCPICIAVIALILYKKEAREASDVGMVEDEEEEGE